MMANSFLQPLTSQQFHTNIPLMGLIFSLEYRFEALGKKDDLDLIIALCRIQLDSCPRSHPKREAYLVWLAHRLCTRYNRWGDVEDLERAVILQRVALDLCPEGHPTRTLTVVAYAGALHSQFEREGNVEVIEKAITLCRTVMACRPDEQHLLHHSFARSLWFRYNKSGNIKDLEESIQLSRADLAHLLERNHQNPISMNNLAISLHSRFQQGGCIEDIEESIKLHRGALACRPEGHPHRDMSLCNLANTLATRFEELGKVEDLDESISSHRSALALRTEGHPDRPMSLINLAISLSRRFEQGKRDEDLTESIALNRAALSIYPQYHTLTSGLLDNLALRLRVQYQESANSEYLDEAIRLHQASLDLRPEGHPDRSRSLNNFGNSFHLRFKKDGRPKDLDNSIAFLREALALRSATSHPGRSMTLNNLATSLHTRFAHNHDAMDIDESIKMLFISVELRPEGHPGRSLVMTNLAESFYNRFEQGGNPEDFEMSVQYFSHAASYSFSSSLSRLKAAKQWAGMAHSHNHCTTLTAYTTTISLLQRSLTIRPTLSTQHNLLSSNTGLALDGAAYAIQEGQYAQAIELLEQGRGLLWSQMHGLRTPLERLHETNSSLAQSFRRISSRLEALMTFSEADHEGASPNVVGQQGTHLDDEKFVLIRVLSEEQEQIVNRVRQTPGFEDFLQAPHFKDLQQAAIEGPVVIINHSRHRSDALIVLACASSPCVCIPLDEEFYMLSLKQCFELLRSRSEFGVGSDNYNSALKEAMKMLWDRVVSKVIWKLKEIGIAEGSRIWWCPTSLLSTLPFHAAGPFKDQCGNTKYLLDDYISSYTPTLWSLIKSRSGTCKDNSRLLFVGVTDLPSTKKEFAAIRGRKFIYKRLLDKKATRDAVITELQNVEWVHFACHGKLDPEPFQSAFQLADGPLTLLDIARTHLPHAEFAFLSACQTAEQTVEGTHDEVLHLAAAMQFCGFKSVIGTMWEMLDEDGPGLARNVYTFLMDELEEGEVRFKKAAAALREAALMLKEKKEDLDGQLVDIKVERWVNFVHFGA